MRCDDKEDYVRAIVNGAVQKLDHCQSGPGKSCPIEQFASFVEGRMKEYGDIDTACKAKDEDDKAE